MKFCDGKVVELDPKKWYWLVVRSDVDQETFKNMQMQNGTIIIVDELEQIEFVENPDRIKGIIIKEF